MLNPCGQAHHVVSGDVQEGRIRHGLLRPQRIRRGSICNGPLGPMAKSFLPLVLSSLVFRLPIASHVTEAKVARQTRAQSCQNEGCAKRQPWLES